MPDSAQHLAGAAPRIAYHGRLGEAWRLALKTTLLTIATVGIYRFWAKTRIRRYFWSRVTVAGEPLEYLGAGLELFLGFLIVLAILAPLYGAMIVGQLLLADPLWLAGALQSVPPLIFLALIPVAVFRARRYRLSRTAWRGVRAGQTGSTWSYWIRACGYGLAGWLTLGLLRPLAHLRLTGHLMNHTWFGTTRFGFAAPFMPLFWRWLPVWIFGLATVLSFVVIPLRASLESGWANDLLGEAGRRSIIDFGSIAAILPAAFVMSLVGAVCWLLAYLNYRIFRFRYFVAATRLDGLSFQSNLRFWGVVGIILVLILMYAAILGAFTGIGAAIHPVFGFATGGLVGAFLAATLLTPFFTHPLLKKAVEALVVAGAIDLNSIVQNPETAPQTGEGLASVFDVDAF